MKSKRSMLCRPGMTCVVTFALIKVVSGTPAGAAVGRVAGNFSVSPSGAAMYSMPIAVADAAGGMRPDLTLIYNSRASDGLAGVGWDLAGFSTIARCGLTIALDTRRQGVTYTNEDRFCLDGQPLVKISSGIYGGNNVEYRQEIHNYEKVTSHGTAGTGPKYFKVQLSNGLTHYYGDSVSSRIEAPNTSEVRVWALTRIVDKFSNQIEFVYNERPEGEYDPQKVIWGQNNYTLEFSYEDRPDVRNGFVAGSPWTRTRRLTHIRYKFQGNEVHDYRLAYQAPAPITGRSRLASVTQCAGADCLPPTTFDWQNGFAGWGSALNSEGGGEVYFDFDGDGDMDRVDTTGGVLSLSRVDKGVYGPSQGTFLTVDTNPCLGCEDFFPVPLDYNGDGLTDLLVVADDDNYHVYVSNADSHESLWGLFVDFDTQLPRADTAPVGAGAFDVDGDGLSDLVYLVDNPPSGGRVRFRKNLGARFSTVESDTGLWAGSDGGAYSMVVNRNLAQPDFDGDGRQDLILRVAKQSGPYGFVVYYDAYLSTGDNFSTVLYGSTSAFTGLPGVRIRTPDINGDGLSDVVFESATGWSTMISDGSGFRAPVHTSIDVFNGDFGDYDSDGRSDLLESQRVYLSDGESYSSANSVPISFYNCFCARLVDADGDGDLDVVSGSTVRLHNGPRADLVTGITDGLGNYHRPAYGLLSQDGVGYIADRTTGIRQPVTTSGATVLGDPPRPPGTRLVHGGPMPVVKSTQQNDGAGSPYTMSYNYWNAQLDMQGRGFLGFAQVQAVDSRTNGYSMTAIYHQDFPYIGQLKFRRTLRAPAGPREEILTWGSFQQWGLEVIPFRAYYFVRQDSSDDISYEEDSTPRLIKRVNHQYVWNEAHGAVAVDDEFIHTDTWQGPAPNLFHTRREFLNFDAGLMASQWCLGRATRLNVTTTFPDAQPVTETRTTLSAYASGSCALIEERVGSAIDPGEQLKTTFGLDAQGRTETITRNDGVNGLPARATRFSYPNPWTSRAISETSVVDNQPDPIVNRTWNEGLGLIESVTNVQGLTTAWDYDGFGRLSREEQTGLGAFTDLGYTSPCTGWCPNNSQYTITSQRSDGFWSKVHYDRYGRQVGLAQALLTGESRQATVYDDEGRVSAEVLPYLAGEAQYRILYLYDSLNRRTQARRPADESDTAFPGLAVTRWTHAYDTEKFENAESNSTWYLYRPDGKIHQVTEAPLTSVGVTNYRYTPFGELASITDPDDTGPATTMTFDALGNPSSRTDADTGTWAFEYNVFGELVSQQDDQGHQLTVSYDQLGRITARDEDEGATTWAYIQSGNGFGLPDTVTAPTTLSPGGFTKSHSYNALGQLSRTVTRIDGTPYQTDYDYNGQGRLAVMTYPETIGHRPHFTYEYINGYLHTVGQDFGLGSSIPIYQVLEVDARGRETFTISGENFIESRASYDRGNARLTGLATIANLQSGVTSIQDFAYQWDKVGNLTERRDLNNALSETFVYDELNRLTETWLDGQRTQFLTYHPDGRINAKSGDGAYQGVGVYTYENGVDSNAVTSIVGDRANTYHYDGNGNMDCRGDTASLCASGDTIVWYSFNKPASIQYRNGARVDSSTFVYDADRRRVKHRIISRSGIRNIEYVDTHFERETQGSATRYRSFVFANGRAVYALHETRTTLACGGTSFSSNPYFIHRDHQGSVDRMTLWDTSGAGSVASSYDAFGKRRNLDWTPDTTDFLLDTNHVSRRGYTGHEHLDNVRLIHMNGRLQDPIIGRMISADPLIGDLRNPQTLNRYSYVVNNPATLVDPSGFEVGCDSSPNACIIEVVTTVPRIPVLSLRFADLTSDNLQTLIQQVFGSNLDLGGSFGLDELAALQNAAQANQLTRGEQDRLDGARNLCAQGGNCRGFVNRETQALFEKERLHAAYSKTLRNVAGTLGVTGLSGTLGASALGDWANSGKPAKFFMGGLVRAGGTIFGAFGIAVDTQLFLNDQIGALEYATNGFFVGVGLWYSPWIGSAYFIGKELFDPRSTFNEMYREAVLDKVLFPSPTMFGFP